MRNHTNPFSHTLSLFPSPAGRGRAGLPAVATAQAGVRVHNMPQNKIAENQFASFNSNGYSSLNHFH